MSSAPLKDKALCLIRQQIQIFSLIACPLPYSRLGTGTASNATAAELKAFFGFFQLFHLLVFLRGEQEIANIQQAIKTTMQY